MIDHVHEPVEYVPGITWEYGWGLFVIDPITAPKFYRCATCLEPMYGVPA